MWIIGLTGALGAGKSTLARHMGLSGVPVHSADREVHRLFREDKDVRRQIKAWWPDVFVGGEIDRLKLGEEVLSSKTRLRKLEDLLYPKIAKAQRNFLLNCQKRRVPIVALDVPLLVEVGLDEFCHVVVLAAAPNALRQKRALRRKGMSLKRLGQFEENQLEVTERRKKADFVIRTGLGKEYAVKKVKEILSVIKNRPKPKWGGRWPTTLKRKPYGQGNRSRYRNNWV